VLGGLFDSIGRPKIIAGCYGVAGLGLLATGFLFSRKTF